MRRGQVGTGRVFHTKLILSTMTIIICVHLPTYVSSVKYRNFDFSILKVFGSSFKPWTRWLTWISLYFLPDLNYTHFFISIMMLSKRLWKSRFRVSIKDFTILMSDAYFEIMKKKIHKLASYTLAKIGLSWNKHHLIYFLQFFLKFAGKISVCEATFFLPPEFSPPVLPLVKPQRSSQLAKMK